MYLLMIYGAGAVTTALIVGISNHFKKRHSKRAVLQHDLQNRFRRMLQEYSDNFSRDEQSIYELSQKYRESMLAIESSSPRKATEIAHNEISKLEYLFSEASKYGEMSRKEYLDKKVAECDKKYARLKERFASQYYRELPARMHNIKKFNLSHANREVEEYIESTLSIIEELSDPMNMVFKMMRSVRELIEKNDDVFHGSLLDKIEREISLIETQESWGSNPERELKKKWNMINLKYAPHMILNKALFN